MLIRANDDDWTHVVKFGLLEALKSIDEALLIRDENALSLPIMSIAAPGQRAHSVFTYERSEHSFAPIFVHDVCEACTPFVMTSRHMGEETVTQLPVNSARTSVFARRTSAAAPKGVARHSAPPGKLEPGGAEGGGEDEDGGREEPEP